MVTVKNNYTRCLADQCPLPPGPGESWCCMMDGPQYRTQTPAPELQLISNTEPEPRPEPGSVVSVSECSGESGALVPDGLITTARESERFYRADNK